MCDTCLNVDCQKSNSDFILFQQELRCSLWGSTITFQVFYVEISNLIFFWNKYLYRYLENVLYLQFEDIWNLHLLSIVNDFLCSKLEPCEVFFATLFHICLPAALLEVITEFWTAKFSSLFSIIILLSSVFASLTILSLSRFLKNHTKRHRLGPFLLLQMLDKM